MRWIRRGLAVLAGVIVVALAVVYGGSEWILRSSHAVPLSDLTVPTDMASIADGGRLAKVMGCRDCHGANGEGQVMVESAMLGTIAAPSLARASASYSNAELVRAVRQGVRRDGTALWVMPTGAYRNIADDDMARIIAWIRTRRPDARDSGASTRFGPLGRGLVLAGVISPSVVLQTVAQKARPADTGHYYVDTVCSGCHALDHERPAEDGSGIVPALAPVAAAYDPAQFRTLLRTGNGLSKRDLGLMRKVALAGLSSLRDDEIAAIHAYLRQQADKQAN